MDIKRYLFVLPAVLLAVAAVGCIRGVGGDTGPIIDPNVYELLEQDGEVKVLVSLRNLPGPVSEWDLAERDVHTAQMRANVLSVLTEDDIREPWESKGSAIGGYITASGLEKLRTHPDVIAVGAVGLGSFGDLPVEVAP